MERPKIVVSPLVRLQGFEPRSLYRRQSGHELRWLTTRSTECGFALRDRKVGVFGCADIVPRSESAGEDIETAPYGVEVDPDLDIQRSRQFVSLDRDEDIARPRILDLDNHIELEPRIDAFFQRRQSIGRPFYACLRIEEIVLTRVAAVESRPSRSR
jgi:hypothetical protein